MEEMMSHPLDEKIRNNPDYLASLPENLRSMYLLSKEMSLNTTIKAVERIARVKKWSEEEKQNEINKAIRLKNPQNWTEEEIAKVAKCEEEEEEPLTKAAVLKEWHCEVCDKDIRSSSKKRHLNSKRHKNKMQ